MAESFDVDSEDIREFLQWAVSVAMDLVVFVNKEVPTNQTELIEQWDDIHDSFFLVYNQMPDKLEDIAIDAVNDIIERENMVDELMKDLDDPEIFNE